MMTALDLSKFLGVSAMQARLGFKHPSAVRNRAYDGKFPASWYLILSAMCDERGVECPVDLFDFHTGGPFSQEPRVEAQTVA